MPSPRCSRSPQIKKTEKQNVAKLSSKDVLASQIDKMKRTPNESVRVSVFLASFSESSKNKIVNSGKSNTTRKPKLAYNSPSCVVPRLVTSPGSYNFAIRTG